jgi:anti-sigma regulatory factor (Ser/Thr protein kinase)
MLVHLTNSHPNSILYLIPVAFGAALLGIWGGYATALAALVMDWVVIGKRMDSWHDLNSPDAIIRLLMMSLSMMIVATVTGRLHESENDMRRLHARVLESEKRRHLFSQEVLHAVTGGRLMLCDDTEIRALIGDEPPIATVELKEPCDVSMLRHLLRDIIESVGYPFCGIEDLEIAATEAGANAVKYGGGGTAEIRATPGEISLLVIDHGEGISPTHLARATLERGFSTAATLGVGFTIMLECADMLALSSSSSGTLVLLRRYNAPLPKVEERLLAS